MVEKTKIPRKKANEAFRFNNKVGCLHRLLFLLHLQLERHLKVVRGPGLAFLGTPSNYCYAAKPLNSKVSYFASLCLRLSEFYGSSILSCWPGEQM